MQQMQDKDKIKL